MARVSGQTIVEAGAEVADSATVGPFSYVGSEVRIGAGLVLVLLVGLLLWSVLAEFGSVSGVGPTVIATPPANEIVVDIRDDVSLPAIDAWDDPIESRFPEASIAS